MIIVESDKLREVKDVMDVCVKIPLTNDNELKFPMEILYYKEQGFTKFMLEYEFNFLKPFEKTIVKIKEPIYNLVKNHNIEIYVSGFPKCIFEKGLLEPQIKWKYEEKIIFHQDKNFETEKYIKPHTCEMCVHYDTCKGLKEEIYDPKGKLDPLLSNLKKSEVIEVDIKQFLTGELLPITEALLENYKADKTFGNKQIYFGSSILKSSNKVDEVVYYINNNSDRFENIFDLICELFKTPDIEILKEHLQLSPHITLKFWENENLEIEKSIYLTLLKHKEEDIIQLSNTFGFEIDNVSNLEGVKFGFEDEMLTYCEVIYHHELIKNDQVKVEFKDYELESKRWLLKFLNSTIKPIREVTIANKYRFNKLVGKRFDTVIEENNFKLNSLGVLFGKSVMPFNNCKPYSLSFRISNENSEVIKIYFSCEDEIKEED